MDDPTFIERNKLIIQLIAVPILILAVLYFGNLFSNKIEAWLNSF